MQALLMGGQACVLYGAAEFSRDSDFAIVANEGNLRQLRAALVELEARVVAVPPFEINFLKRGHAVHFRCFCPDCDEMRVDIMAKMRGVAPFEELWERRTTFELAQGETVEVLAINDLVNAKKTQRNKDWPMIQRLMEAHYFRFRAASTPVRIDFWLAELRTPALLREVTRSNAAPSEREAAILARDGASDESIEAALLAEEQRERQLDREYWRPLKAELEILRHQRNSSSAN